MDLKSFCVFRYADSHPLRAKKVICRFLAPPAFLALLLCPIPLTSSYRVSHDHFFRSRRSLFPWPDSSLGTSDPLSGGLSTSVLSRRFFNSSPSFPLRTAGLFCRRPLPGPRSGGRGASRVGPELRGRGRFACRFPAPRREFRGPWWRPPTVVRRVRRALRLPGGPDRRPRSRPSVYRRSRGPVRPRGRPPRATTQTANTKYAAKTLV